MCTVEMEDFLYIFCRIPNFLAFIVDNEYGKLCLYTLFLGMRQIASNEIIYPYMKI